MLNIINYTGKCDFLSISRGLCDFMRYELVPVQWNISRGLKITSLETHCLFNVKLFYKIIMTQTFASFIFIYIQLKMIIILKCTFENPRYKVLHIKSLDFKTDKTNSVWDKTRNTNRNKWQFRWNTNSIKITILHYI